MLIGLGFSLAAEPGGWRRLTTGPGPAGEPEAAAEACDALLNALSGREGVVEGVVEPLLPTCELEAAFPQGRKTHMKQKASGDIAVSYCWKVETHLYQFQESLMLESCRYLKTYQVSCWQEI